MSKIDDFIEKKEKEIKNNNIDLNSTKFGKLYKKNLDKYNEYKKEDKNLTEEQKKELKKYYITQAICITIAVILVIFLVVRIIQINM